MIRQGMICWHTSTIWKKSSLQYVCHAVTEGYCTGPTLVGVGCNPRSWDYGWFNPIHDDCLVGDDPSNILEVRSNIFCEVEDGA